MSSWNQKYSQSLLLHLFSGVLRCQLSLGEKGICWGHSVKGIIIIPSTPTTGCPPFSSKSSKYHKSKTVIARELKIWKIFHPPKHVTCHVSHVTFHMSHFTCQVSCASWHMSHVTCSLLFYLFFVKVVKLIGGGSVINRNRPTPSILQWCLF